MSELYELFSQHPRISTDTRRIEPDSIFFALRGDTFDGNRFVAEALEKGAAYAVSDDPQVAASDERQRIVLVDDTLKALQDLARCHRRALGIPILAISGSNGKTTTKELVSRVLAERFEVYATRGNLNNHIGVPLTLLAMTRDTEFGVVEMGASACGELALLTSVAEPGSGILTNIGRAHLAGFGGPEGIRRGKGELFDYLAANGGRTFVPSDDRVLTEMAAERDSLAAEYYPVSLADGMENHLEGAYNRYNIAAAVAVGRYFGIPDERIRRAIAGYVPDNNRSQRTETARNTLVIDCYNANPLSMRLAVESFLAEPLGRRHWANGPRTSTRRSSARRRSLPTPSCCSSAANSRKPAPRSPKNQPARPSAPRAKSCFRCCGSPPSKTPSCCSKARAASGWRRRSPSSESPAPPERRASGAAADRDGTAQIPAPCNRRGFFRLISKLFCYFCLL